MEYAEEFERAFMKRTLSLIKSYDGPHDATLLLNCLVGLLIVPRETALNRIPLDPIESLSKWGLSPESILAIARATRQNPQPDTLRGIVYNLRNAVAHFRFTPIHQQRKVKAFRFTDDNGFDATIPVQEMRVFVERLSQYLERN
jgi:HEPN pEK499 p136